MAKAIIYNAAGATTGFLHETGQPRLVSEGDHEIVLTARVLSGPFRGETAEITWIGTFDSDAGLARISGWHESVGGERHFSLKLDREVSLDRLLSGDYHEPLTLIGNRFENVIECDRTDDRLFGKAGADDLIGLRGADTLEGGFGADRFVFRAAADSTAERRDTIRDFRDGADVIHLKAVDADTGARGNQAFAFIGDDAFTGTAGELRADERSGVTVLLGDVDGDGGADLAIRLAGEPTIVEPDLVL
jgi:hypothetical protein